MDLVLLVVFLILSFVLITLGLFKLEHTELALIGFVFLFLLSFSFLNSDITYKIGEDINTTYIYAGANLNTTLEFQRDVYDTYTAGVDFSHSVGYWLAIISVLGFIGCFMGMPSFFKRGDDDE